LYIGLRFVRFIPETAGDDIGTVMSGSLQNSGGHGLAASYDYNYDVIIPVFLFFVLDSGCA
jgi:hypothetical protein